MKSHITKKEISLFIDGFLNKKKREALRAHFADCPLCKKSLEQAESLKASLSTLSRIEEAPGFDFEFSRKLNERIDQNTSAGFITAARGKISRLFDSIIIPVPAALKIAASLLLILSISFIIRTRAMEKNPFIEFSAGNARIYRQSVNAWVMARPNLRLRPGDKIELEDGAIVNLASKGKYKARIKDDSLIIISKIESGFDRIDTDFSISRGKLLVNTSDSFKGSSMRIFTPSCDVEVIGTAFMIEVSENTAWLGVLEGTVKLTSRPHPLRSEMDKPVDTFVSAGQKAYTRQYEQTTSPELLSNKEWQSMLELYQLVDNPQTMLLIGTGVDRIDGLLGRPATVYIPDSIKRGIPRSILESIYDLTDSAKGDDLDLIAQKANSLLRMLSGYPGMDYETEVMMFIASHLHYAKDYKSALEALEQVIVKYPNSEMASLAYSGMAFIYQHDLSNIKRARQMYSDLIKFYPNSAEAIKAREILSAQR